MSHRVAVIGANEDSLRQAVRKGMSLIGDVSIGKESRILIKPNLCTVSPPGSGMTTDVRVVEALVDYLLELQPDCEITLVESNSDYSADEAFSRLGYEELAETYGLQTCNLSKDSAVKLEVTNSKRLAYVDIPETVLFADYLISVAKLKTHAFERISGIWKNQFGLLPRKSLRPRLHPFISEILLDLNRIFMPDLSVIDGIVSLEGAGPIEGKPRRTGILIFSYDSISADIVAAQIMGFDPKSVPHLLYALKHGFENSQDILVTGEDIDSLTAGQGKFVLVPKMSYALYRASLQLGRIGSLFQNLGSLSFVSAFAIRTVGISQLGSGKIFSLKRLVREARDILFKFEA